MKTELLIHADSFMGASGSHRKPLSVESPKKMTRTTLVIAYYYYYNALHLNDGIEKWKTFEDLFDDFRMVIDRILYESGYQGISGKNLFDVLIVFSSYAYMNI